MLALRVVSHPLIYSPSSWHLKYWGRVLQLQKLKDLGLVQHLDPRLCRYVQAELVHARFAMTAVAGILIPGVSHPSLESLEHHPGHPLADFPQGRQSL